MFEQPNVRRKGRNVQTLGLQQGNPKTSSILDQPFHRFHPPLRYQNSVMSATNTTAPSVPTFYSEQQQRRLTQNASTASFVNNPSQLSQFSQSSHRIRSTRQIDQYIQYYNNNNSNM